MNLLAWAVLALSAVVEKRPDVLDADVVRIYPGSDSTSLVVSGDWSWLDGDADLGVWRDASAR